jgi:hypothetical protein
VSKQIEKHKRSRRKLFKMSEDEYYDLPYDYSPASNFEPDRTTLQSWPDRRYDEREHRRAVILARQLQQYENNELPPVYEGPENRKPTEQQRIFNTAAVHPIEYFAQKYTSPRGTTLSQKVGPTVSQYPWLINKISAAQNRLDSLDRARRDIAVASHHYPTPDTTRQYTKALGFGANASAHLFHDMSHGMSPFNPSDYRFQDRRTIYRPMVRPTTNLVYPEMRTAQLTSSNDISSHEMMNPRLLRTGVAANTRRRPLYQSVLKKYTGRRGLKVVVPRKMFKKK